jgi:hypothetical protein
MEMKKFFTDQLEREVAASSKVLERVPEGRNDWKPHERSMPMGYLAALVAQMPAWIAMMLTTKELNLDDKAASGNFQAKPSESSKALLRLADDSAEKAKSALSDATEDHFNVMWSLQNAWQDVEQWATTSANSGRFHASCASSWAADRLSTAQRDTCARYFRAERR